MRNYDTNPVIDVPVLGTLPRPPAALAGLLAGMDLRDPTTWADYEKAAALGWVAEVVGPRYLNRPNRADVVEAMEAEATQLIHPYLRAVAVVVDRVYYGDVQIRFARTTSLSTPTGDHMSIEITNGAFAEVAPPTPFSKFIALERYPWLPRDLAPGMELVDDREKPQGSFWTVSRLQWEEREGVAVLESDTRKTFWYVDLDTRYIWEHFRVRNARDAAITKWPWMLPWRDLEVGQECEAPGILLGTRKVIRINWAAGKVQFGNFQGAFWNMEEKYGWDQLKRVEPPKPSPSPPPFNEKLADLRQKLFEAEDELRAARDASGISGLDRFQPYPHGQLARLAQAYVKVQLAANHVDYLCSLEPTSVEFWWDWRPGTEIHISHDGAANRVGRGLAHPLARFGSLDSAELVLSRAGWREPIMGSYIWVKKI